MLACGSLFSSSQLARICGVRQDESRVAGCYRGQVIGELKQSGLTTTDCDYLATLTQLNITNPKTFTMTADPGKEGTLTIPSGTYRVEVTLDGSTTVLPSETLSVSRQSATFIYAVGQATNNSVRLARKTVPEVF
jgi:hypothetical protein